MNFVATPLAGVFLIEPEPIRDERGFFARTFCAEDFACHGLRSQFVQCSISFNARAGTLRGMHWQAPPHAEAKLIRCTQGAIYDVALDLRPASPTFKHWYATELTAENRRMLYVPEGCAHGFQTLVDDSEVLYQISAAYEPSAKRGAHWNDPEYGIQWPLPRKPILSVQDMSYTYSSQAPASTQG